MGTDCSPRQPRTSWYCQSKEKNHLLWLMLRKGIIKLKCQFINLQRGMSVTRTGMFKVRVISIFSSYMKPIYSFKKENNYHRLWDIQSTNDQQILSLRGADLLIYKEKLLSKRPDTQSPRGQHFSASPSPFMESRIMIGRLLREHEVWSEWMSKETGLRQPTNFTPPVGPDHFAIWMSALCLSSASCPRMGTASAASCCLGFHRWPASLCPAHSLDVLLPSNRWLSFTPLESFSLVLESSL